MSEMDQGKATGSPSAEKTPRGLKAAHPVEYSTWHQMKMRCRNPKSDSYKEYGARGITVCDAWLSFEQFLADMGKRPSPQYSIERKDGSGNYEPGNCHWATKIEQNNNRSNVTLHFFRGRYVSVGAAIRESGSNLSHATVHHRVKSGMGLERALELPVNLAKSRRSANA